ncbi:plastocyanin [Variovorax sp. J22R24]|uniref:cupredoxin domain-containing protein n=1 Tax=Variovorax gracilis TaxID=3053502 RepID=UPI002577CAD8|nr:plastocyanin/azurin family copper-binding protein [Variovorax sp. J22R24]MDM0107158.1 plastocyanin [Variovorax sp. J22R24]
MGTPPRLRVPRLRSSAIALAGALACALCAATPLQVSVLDKDGQPVVDAVVVVATASKASPARPLPREVTISQEKMRFVPAVSLVAVGAKARFVNNDPWEHHVRASAAGVMQFDAGPAGGFELMIAAKPEGKPGKVADATFEKAGAVLLGCHLHNSMRGHVYVSDSPWAALTGMDGLATIDVPEGAASVKVWHADQLIDIAPLQVMLGDAPAKATLQLNVVPRRKRI